MTCLNLGKKKGTGFNFSSYIRGYNKIFVLSEKNPIKLLFAAEKEQSLFNYTNFGIHRHISNKSRSRMICHML